MTSEQENSESGRTGVFPALSNLLFGKPSPKARPSGMTFDERVRHIASLLAIRRRGERENLYDWAAEVNRRFLAIPSLKVLVEGFPKSLIEKQTPNAGFPPLDAEERLYERQIRDFIETGLRLIQEHPVSAFGSETQYLIAQKIDDQLWDSGPMRLIKFVGPILVILFFGGAIYGGYKLEGLQQTASRATKDIRDAQDNIQKLASDSALSITALKDKALQEWKEHLDSAANSAVDAFKAEIEATKNTGIRKIDDNVNQELSDIRAHFGEAVGKQATDAIVTRRDNILDVLKTSEDGVASSITAVKSKINVQYKEIDQAYFKAIQDITDVENKTINPTRLNNLTERLTDIEKLIPQAMTLDTELKRSLDFRQILFLIEWKDILIVVAFVSGTVAFILSWLSFRNSLTTGPSPGVTFMGLALVAVAVLAGIGSLFLYEKILSDRQLQSFGISALVYTNDPARGPPSRSGEPVGKTDNLGIEPSETQLKPKLTDISNDLAREGATAISHVDAVETSVVASLTKRSESISATLNHIDQEAIADSLELQKVSPEIDRLKGIESRIEDVTKQLDDLSANELALLKTNEKVDTGLREVVNNTSAQERTLQDTKNRLASIDDKVKIAEGRISAAEWPFESDSTALAQVTAPLTLRDASAADRLNHSPFLSSADLVPLTLRVANLEDRVNHPPILGPADLAPLTLRITNVEDRFNHLPPVPTPPDLAPLTLRITDVEDRFNHLPPVPTVPDLLPLILRITNVEDRFNHLPPLPSAPDLSALTLRMGTVEDRLNHPPVPPAPDIAPITSHVADIDSRLKRLEQPQVQIFPTTEDRLSPDQKKLIQKALGIKEDGDFGGPYSKTRKAIQQFRNGELTPDEIKELLSVTER